MLFIHIWSFIRRWQRYPVTIPTILPVLYQGLDHFKNVYLANILKSVHTSWNSKISFLPQKGKYLHEVYTSFWLSWAFCGNYEVLVLSHQGSKKMKCREMTCRFSPHLAAVTVVCGVGRLQVLKNIFSQSSIIAKNKVHLSACGKEENVALGFRDGRVIK